MMIISLVIEGLKRIYTRLYVSSGIRMLNVILDSEVYASNVCLLSRRPGISTKNGIGLFMGHRVVKENERRQ